jgi:hypothetical protein
VRSILDLPHPLEWDNALGYVSKLADGNVPVYASVDCRLAWPRHVEIVDGYGVNRTVAERSVFGKVTWRF